MTFPTRLAAVLLLLPTLLAAQSRVVVDTVPSDGLRGNRIGESNRRAVYVYLPPSYDQSPGAKYPVLYLLHGMTSHPSEWLDGSYQDFNLAETMDSLSRAGSAEYIVVMPHADNSYGGTFYVNSVAFGDWEKFVTRELVRFVDRRYRTVADRRSRGLAGQSMGGFGALYLAARHADRFGSVYAMSPCCMGFVGELAPASETWKLVAAPDSEVPAGLRGRMRIVRAMATAFARTPELTPTGRPERPVLGALPYQPDGSENRVAWRTWHGYLPLERLRHDLPAYHRLAAIGLDFGSADAIASVPLGSREFAAGLRAGGIAPFVVEHDGGHVDRARERFSQGLLPFFARIFRKVSSPAAEAR